MVGKAWAAALFIVIGIGVTVSSRAANKFRYPIAPAVNKDPDSVSADEEEISSANLVFKQRLDSIQKTVPLPYNKYVQDYINIYVSRSAQIGRVLGLSEYYFPIYEKAFKENNVPDELKFISIVESSLDPNAVSRVGATGLWQFMFTTAKVYGLTMDNYVDERKDPIAASNAAAHYLRNSFEEFGDWLLAIASYNCGTQNVERAIAKAGGIKDFWAIRPYLPKETRNYVPAFIATAYVMKCFAMHNISKTVSDFPAITDIIQVNRFVSLENIAGTIGLDPKKLSLLNPSYKKRIINGTTDAPKSLVIPALDKGLYDDLYTALNTVEMDPKIILASTRVESERPTYHKVRSGENLSVIADRYHVEVQDLKVWNKLKSLLIHPGQMLRVSSSR
jgi:membrane-bound lytic murein transglycosylase D